MFVTNLLSHHLVSVLVTPHKIKRGVSTTSPLISRRNYWVGKCWRWLSSVDGMDMNSEHAGGDIVELYFDSLKFHII